MDDHMLDLVEPGDRVVGRLLQAYGEDVLSPSIAATTRMRMMVMAASHRRAALIEADATFDAAGETTAARSARRAAAIRSAWRRPVAAVMAGCLTLGILAGTAFAARPGGPLYEARIWTEMANLPAGVVDRAQAEVSRLDQRITEAQQASTAGDGVAAQAALVAYSRIVVEATAGTRQDPAAKATLGVTVTRHVAVLTQMVVSVPEPARDAAEQALTTTSLALDTLEPATQPSSGGAGAAPAGVPQGPQPPAPAPTPSEKPSKHDELKPEKHRPGGDKTPKPAPPKAP
jgi:hypothetical protein